MTFDETNDEKDRPRVDLQEERSRMKKKEKDYPAGSGLGPSEEQEVTTGRVSKGQPPRILVDMLT